VNFRTVIQRGALVIGGVAVVVSTTAGVASAQTTSTNQKQAVISLAATQLGLSPDQLADALKQARKDLGATGNHPRARDLAANALTVAAHTLGLADAKALRRELRGTTLTTVAQNHNVAPATVAAAIKADVDTRIQALVTAGTLKPAAATRLTQKADARVDNLMTRAFKP